MLSCLEYADILWDGCCDVDSLQFEAARVVTEALKGTHRESLLKETAWTTLKDRRCNHKLSMMYKIVRNLAPPYLTESDNLVVLYARIERFKKTFLISSVNLWNDLPSNIRS